MENDGIIDDIYLPTPSGGNHATPLLSVVILHHSPSIEPCLTGAVWGRFLTRHCMKWGIDVPWWFVSKV